MIDRNTPSDPRLRERRGDLVGIYAILFAIALVVALSITAFLVITFVPDPFAAQASSTPTRSPGPATPTASTSARPSPSGSSGASATPSPTRTPSSTASPVVAVTTTVGSETTMLVDGGSVGTVSAGTPELRRRIDGNSPPAGQQWATVEVRLTASSRFDYSAGDWQIQDANGDRHPWAHVDPLPPLGEGTIDPAETVTGWISFATPADVGITSVILRTPDGQDLVVFELP